MLKKLGLNAEIAGRRLGHADHAPRGQGAGRQRRLEHLPHLARRARHGQPGGELPDPRHRRQGVVRLADATRSSKSCAKPGSRRPTPAESEEGGRRGAAARVRVRAVHPDRRSSSCRRRIARTSPGVDHRADRPCCGTSRRSRRSASPAARRCRRSGARLCSPPARSRPSSSWRWSRSSSSRCSISRPAIRRRSSPATPRPPTTSGASAPTLGLDEPFLVQFGGWVWALAARRPRHLDLHQPAGDAADRRSASSRRWRSTLCTLRRRGAGRGAARRARRCARPAPGSTAR